jgi:hypothetical protein
MFVRVILDGEVHNVMMHFVPLCVFMVLVILRMFAIVILDGMMEIFALFHNAHVSMELVLLQIIVIVLKGTLVKFVIFTHATILNLTN